MQDFKENQPPTQISTIGFLENRTKDLEDENMFLKKEVFYYYFNEKAPKKKKTHFKKSFSLFL